MPASEDPSTDVALRTPTQELVAFIRTPTFEQQVELALPSDVPAARFTRIAITALLENQDVAACHRDSVLNSLLKAAGDGLLPDGREAALVKFQPKVGPPIAVYMPMIGGFRKIAGEHGWTIETTVVYEADDFDYELGVTPTVRHKPAPLGVDRGKIVAAYAVGRQLRTGATVLEVMTAEDVDKVKSKSKASKIGPWVDWPERMTEKTVGRRLFKKLPLGDSERARRVLEADELEPGQAAALVYGPPAGGEPGREGDASTPSVAPEPEPEASLIAPSAPAGFSGEEPPLDADHEDEASRDFAAERELLERDRAVLITIGRHEGKTLGVLADAGEKTYLKWLASDAVEDGALREAAGRVLAGLR